MCVFCTKAFARFAGRLHGFNPLPSPDEARLLMSADGPQPPASRKASAPEPRCRVRGTSGDAMKTAA
jgi:hypothetical protein